MSFMSRLRGLVGGGPGDRRPTVGVALAGGGIRGFAHLGVLEELARVTLIDGLCGASVGALAGALWSAGVPTPLVMERARTFRPFLPWRAQFADAGMFDSGYLHEHWLTLLPETFEELRVPLQVVVTDLETGEAVVFDSGPLREIVLASCALPPLYGAVQIEGKWYVDGGASMNLPVGPLLARHDVVIASEVNPRDRLLPGQRETTLGLASRGLELVFKAATARDHERAHILIEPAALQEIFILDAAGGDRALELGRQTAAEVLSRPEVRRRLRLAGPAVGPHPRAPEVVSAVPAGPENEGVVERPLHPPSS